MSTDLLSLPAVAAELGVSRQRVWKWVRAGRLPASRIAGRWVVERRNCRRPATLPDRWGNPPKLFSDRNVLQG